MRVLILNQYALPPGEAGITRHGDIGAELVRRGHEVTVIASDFDYFSRQRTARRRQKSVSLHDGVRFVWVETGGYVGNDRRRISSMLRYAVVASLAGLRLKPVPDAIIGSSPQPLAALAAHAVARLRRRPWIFEARDVWPSALVDLNAVARGSTTHRVLEGLEKFSYRHSRAVVMIPPDGCKRLGELGIEPAKCVHIPNGASTLVNEAGPIPESLDMLLADAAGRFLLVYTGAIGVPHGFESVVAAIEHLRSTQRELFERLLLLVVGDGVAADSLRSTVALKGLNNLRVHAAIPKAGVRSLLQRADACLMQAAASDHFKYGFSPNKLFDYFAAGKPVLISSSLPTLVDEARAGIRFAPGDPAALADAISQLMNTPEADRLAMGERGRSLVEEKYSIPAITDRYEELLERVVGNSR